MKRATLLFFVLALAGTYAHARDDIASYSVAEALATEDAKRILGSEIAFYFGDSKHGKVEKNFGEVSTSQKANAFGKSDRVACERAFLSAMKSLRDRANREGGNAVIEIKSNYRNNLKSSRDTFECGAGGVMAGVALTAKIAKIQK